MNFNRTLFVWLSVFCFVIMSDVCSHAENGQTTKTVLDNGLTVVIREIPQSQYVATYGLVKTGSATEGEFLGSGISHFVEHMLFKGTHSKEVGELADKILSVGGSINAQTSFDYTMYTLKVPFESFDVAIESLADMLINSTISQEEFDKEREVIFGEMRLYEDRPDRKLSEYLFQTVYQFHPYQYPVIGYKELLSKVTRDDLLKYYATHYTSNNTVLSIAGNVKAQEILPKIKELFANYKRNYNVPRNLVAEPQQITPRHFHAEYKTDLTRMSIAYQSTRLLDADLFALDVVAQILGRNRDARLIQKLQIEKENVFEISTYNYTPIDQGIFVVQSVLSEEKIDEVVRDIDQEIQDIALNGVTEQELNVSKRAVVADYIYGQGSIESLASQQALDEAYSGDFDFSKKYVDSIKAVTNEDIKRVVNKYLQKNQQNIVILSPLGTIKNKPDQSDEHTRQTEKIVLDNGLTLLLTEDHTYSYIYLAAAFYAGSRFETNDTAGLFNLMSNTIDRGTISRSASDIDSFIAQKAMDFSIYSGVNSLNFSMRFLTEDLQESISLLEDLIKNATFDQVEVDKIRQKIYAQIKQQQDSISYVTSTELKKILFTDHAFRLPVSGTAESVENITREQLVEMYRKLLVGNNMVLSISGDFSKAETVAMIKEQFGSLPQREVVVPKVERLQDVTFHDETRLMDKEQAMIIVGFHGPTIYDADYEAVQVLDELMGVSFKGRLFRVIREEAGNAYSVGGSFTPSLDAGYIAFYALTNAEALDKVKQSVLQEIRTIQTELVTDQELLEIQQQLIGAQRNIQETHDNLASHMSLDELYGLGYDYYLKGEERIRAVTKQDVLRVAQKYLNLDQAVIVSTHPDVAKEEE